MGQPDRDGYSLDGEEQEDQEDRLRLEKRKESEISNCILLSHVFVINASNSWHVLALCSYEWNWLTVLSPLSLAHSQQRLTFPTAWKNTSKDPKLIFCPCQQGYTLESEPLDSLFSTLCFRPESHIVLVASPPSSPDLIDPPLGQTARVFHNNSYQFYHHHHLKHGRHFHSPSSNYRPCYQSHLLSRLLLSI